MLTNLFPPLGRKLKFSGITPVLAICSKFLKSSFKGLSPSSAGTPIFIKNSLAFWVGKAWSIMPSEPFAYNNFAKEATSLAAEV